jgi:hypothetical protein
MNHRLNFVMETMTKMIERRKLKKSGRPGASAALREGAVAILKYQEITARRDAEREAGLMKKFNGLLAAEIEKANRPVLDAIRDVGKSFGTNFTATKDLAEKVLAGPVVRSPSVPPPGCRPADPPRR